VSLSYRRTERTTLLIETQEGDLVRLKIKAREAADFAAASTGQNSDVLLSDISASTYSKTIISVFINGNLNADELAAIRDVLAQASNLATSFFAAGVDGAFAAAESLEIDPTQIATAALRMSLRERVAYSQYGPAQPVAAPAPTATEPRADGGADAVPAAASEAAPVPGVNPDAPLPQDSAPEEPAAQTPPAPQTEAPELPTANAAAILATIADFLGQLFATFDQPEPNETGATPAPSITMSLKLKIFQSLLLTMHSTRPHGASPISDPPALPTLMIDTLDSLTAAEQPPLRDRA
jgi:hypothetical protein